MVVWSCLSKVIVRQGVKTLPPLKTSIKCADNWRCRPVMWNNIRNMSAHGPRTMNVTPSRFQWNKFKDLLHFYVMLGAIPVGIIVFCSNVFVGPATLAEIPEGYEPKHWEYFRHPITRFLARYLYPSPQQEYEKLLHLVFEEEEKIKLRKLEQQIRAKMAERVDYQAYYYRPAIAKYHRISKEAADYLESIKGDN